MDPLHSLPFLPSLTHAFNHLYQQSFTQGWVIFLFLFLRAKFDLSNVQSTGKEQLSLFANH